MDVRTPAPVKSEPEKSSESVKETIESILIAFILAFVFRAFVVEAFVIPTGSMAPTLLGAHIRLRCQECGYQFDVNYGTANHDDSDAPKASGVILSMHCPNCGHQVPKNDAKDPAQASTNTPVFYGDRILVLKYLYLFEEPRRWDVVVFKSPYHTTPKARGNWYTQNYIKRLVGKPGETIMLLDGDVYVGHENQEKKMDFQIQRKPRVIQDALWRIMYDNDYYPKTEWTQPWKPVDGSGWKNDDKRVFDFENMSSGGTLRFDPSANPTRSWQPFTDRLAYDETMRQGQALYIDEPIRQGDHVVLRHHNVEDDDFYATDAYSDTKFNFHMPRWNVTDLKLSFFYTRERGDGPLEATVTKLGHTFTATIHPDTVELWHQAPGSTDRKLIGQQKLKAGANRAMKVDLINVDYRVTVRINDDDVIATTDADYQPNVEEIHKLHDLRGQGGDYLSTKTIFPPPTVSISADHQAASVSHVSLWRDVYYTPGQDYQQQKYAASPESGGIYLHHKGDKIEADASHPAYIADDEYFVLGDNSILSADARFWDDDVDLLTDEGLYAASHRVPGRFMIGKAFFVYWPAGFRPFSENMPGIVPNFNDMRFIH